MGDVDPAPSQLTDWVAALAESDITDIHRDIQHLRVQFADKELIGFGQFVTELEGAAVAFRAEADRATTVGRFAIGLTRAAAINGLFRISIATGVMGAQGLPPLVALMLAAPTVADVIAGCRRLSTRQLVLLSELTTRPELLEGRANVLADEQVWRPLGPCDDVMRRALLDSLMRAKVLTEREDGRLSFGTLVD